MNSKPDSMIPSKDKIISNKNLESYCQSSAHGKSTPIFWEWLQVKWWRKLKNPEDKATLLQSDKMLWAKSDQSKTLLLLMPSKKTLKMLKLLLKITLPD